MSDLVILTADDPEPPKLVNLNLTYTSAGQLNQLQAQWETAQDAAAETIRPAIEQLLTKFTALAAQPQPRAITQRKDQP